MMMTHSYYGGEFDAFARSNYRAPASAAHYDRPVPYSHHGYYEPVHQELRSDYHGRPGARTLIQEQTPDNGPSGHARRRIQVACSRCRRRKIKCTGDPGDGSGCSACRSAGADKSTCTFIRVGSHTLPLASVDMLPAGSSTPTTASASVSYDGDTSAPPYGSGTYQTNHRPSLPMLQTRTAYPEYDSYSTSPVDEYAYTSSAIPRNESFSSNYSAESFRPYTSGSISAPTTSTSMYYEPGAAFSFGSLQTAPGFPTSQMTRLPSVTGEAFSPLNMSSLHSTLPTHSVPAQTVQERRLPIPYTQQQPAYTSSEVPQIRPLTSFAEPQPRMHINGIHTRNGMPWVPDSPVVSRSGSISGLLTMQHGIHVPSSVSSSSSLMSEPVLGYQFSAASGSPEISPTAGPALSESYSSAAGASTTGSTMMPPSTHMRYSMSQGMPNLPALSGSGHNERRPSSSHETAAALYSFSAGYDASDRQTIDRNIGQTTSESTPTPNMHYSRPHIRQPQPQHAVSVDELRRRSSYDQRQSRAATSHRMSVSNLNARY